MLYRAGCHKQLQVCAQESAIDQEHCRIVISTERRQNKERDLRISLRPFGPQAHPGCKLQLLTYGYVLRVGFGERQVLEELLYSSIAEIFHRRRSKWSIEVFYQQR